MDERPAGDRRSPRRGGRSGRWTALRAALHRRLADDDRAAYWVRHVRLGVVLTEVAALAVVGYALLTPGAVPRTVVLLALAGAAILAAPLLLVLPVATMVRAPRGSLLFFGWSLAVTGLVAVGSRADGGTDSPLYTLLFITLGFMAVAYPPWGVVAMGAVMTGANLGCVAVGDLVSSASFIAVVMATYTVLCAMASANHWESYDRQQLLLRTSEVLAATDPVDRVPRPPRLPRAAGPRGGRRRGRLGRLSGRPGRLQGRQRPRGPRRRGRAVLRAVPVALGGVVRETDTVVRLEGDGFAVLAAADAGGSEALTARLREAVAVAGAGTGVTASIGATDVRPGDEGDEVLSRADQAMYRAKGAGGNRVTVLAG